MLGKSSHKILISINHFKLVILAKGFKQVLSQIRVAHCKMKRFLHDNICKQLASKGFP